VPAVLAALLVTTTAVVYAAFLRSQGPVAADGPRVAFVAGSLVVAALAFVAGALAPWPSGRPALVGTASVICWVWGVLAIFSLGLLLLAAAVLGTVALVRVLSASARPRVPGIAWLAWIVTLAVLGLGLVVTQPSSGTVHIRCPAKGHWQGTTTSNGATTAYRCDDGRLTSGP